MCFILLRGEAGRTIPKKLIRLGCRQDLKRELFRFACSVTYALEYEIRVIGLLPHPSLLEESSDLSVEGVIERFVLFAGGRKGKGLGLRPIEGRTPSVGERECVLVLGLVNGAISSEGYGQLTLSECVGCFAAGPEEVRRSSSAYTYDCQ